MKSAIQIVVVIFLLLSAIVLAGCLGIVLLGRSGSGVSLRAGNIVAVRAGDDYVLLAQTPEDLDRIVRLSLANDGIGLSQMVSSGRAFSVSPGTKARVIDGGLLSSEVRIVEGIHVGRSGWIHNEWLKAK